MKTWPWIIIAGAALFAAYKLKTSVAPDAKPTQIGTDAASSRAQVMQMNLLAAFEVVVPDGGLQQGASTLFPSGSVLDNRQATYNAEDKYQGHLAGFI